MLYHGVSINSEMIAIVIGVIVWIIRGIARGLRQIKGRPGSPLPPPQAAPPQNPFQAQAPLQTPLPTRTPPAQALQERVNRMEQARTQPRQPSAGGPAVPVETDRNDFVRQEQELFASEPAALDTLLVSPSSRPAAQTNALFSGPDDLVRAIILQEVLGPPLSRRKSAAPAPSSSSASQ